MSRKFFSILAALLVFSLMFGACAPSEAPVSEEPAEEEAVVEEPETDEEAVEEAPEAPKEVKIALNGEPNSLDPTFAAGRLTQAFLCNIYDSLTVHNPDGTLEPGLAVSWESIDEYTWQFKLREGVTFHNGEPFTAESVKVSIDRIFDPENSSPMIGRIGPIDEVIIVDDYTVNITTETPDVLLPVRLSELYGSIVPAQYVSEVGNEEFGKAPKGTGPFKYVEWVKDERIVLEANEDYWRGAPQVDKITVYPIKEDAARMAALQTGEIDISAGVPAFMVSELESSLQVVKVPSTRFFFLVMRTDMPPFDDVRVRQALNYALDVPALIEGVQFGYGHQVDTVVIPQAFGFDPTVGPYPYDPDMAKQLLADAGYPDGLDIVFDAFTGSIVDHAAVAEAVAGQLEEVGIKTTLNVTEFGVFKPTALENNTAPLYIYSYGEWALDADNTFYLMLQAKSGYYYDNPDTLALYEQERGTFDESEREVLLKQLQKVFYDEAPYGFLYQIDTIWGMQENVDYTPRTDELTWFYKIALK